MATRRGANFVFKWVQHCGVCILKKEQALCSAASALLHTVKTGCLRTWRLPTQNAVKMVPKRFINGAGGTLKFLLWFLLPLKAFPSPAAQTCASTAGSAANPARPPGPGFRWGRGGRPGLQRVFHKPLTLPAQPSYAKPPASVLQRPNPVLCVTRLRTAR